MSPIKNLQKENKYEFPVLINKEEQKKISKIKKTKNWKINQNPTNPFKRSALSYTYKYKEEIEEEQFPELATVI